MTQYNSFNVKPLNSQLNKLNSAIKNETEVFLRLSSNMIGNSNDETNFLHKLLLTNRQIANIRKAFANNSSVDIKLSKTQLSEMIQSGGFLGKLLGLLLKTGLSLIENVIKPLAKSVLIPLGLTAAAASAADAGILIKILGSGKCPLDSGLLLKGVSETIQNEAKEQKGGFLSMLSGTSGASLSGNILAGKGITRTGYGSK